MKSRSSCEQVADFTGATKPGSLGWGGHQPIKIVPLPTTVYEVPISTLSVFRGQPGYGAGGHSQQTIGTS